MKSITVFSGLVVLVSLVSASSRAALKTNWILSGFVEETGSELGYGHYESDTASSGKQCKASFRVAEGREFSLTGVTVKGPNTRPVAVAIKAPSGAGGALAPAPQSDGTGWTSTSHAADGMKNHDGAWYVYLPRVKSAKTGALGCSGHDAAVRVVFSASP